MDARHPAMAVAIAQHSGGCAVLAQQLLNFVLFITVLMSGLAFIEPSPHDVLIFALFLTCVMARVQFDRKLTPLLFLTVLWLVGGAMSSEALRTARQSARGDTWSYAAARAYVAFGS